MVTLTALIPGIGIGLMGKSRHWSDKRCRRTALITAFGLWILCGLVAAFAAHSSAWGWFSNDPIEQQIAGVVWYLAVLLAPPVAVKVAYPATKITQLRLW